MTDFSCSRPVLLVEDNPMDLDLTLRAFSRRKFVNPVQVARDGQEAVEWIGRWEAGETMPLLILLDLNLPRLHGLEVLSRLKSSAVSRYIPVVVLTSSAEDRDIAEAYKLGANSYIVKPVDFDKFLRVTEQIELYWCITNKSPC